MRIAHIVDFYYPKIGGLERAVQRLAGTQAKLGYNVIVVTSNVNRETKREVIDNVRIVRLKAIKIIYDDLLIPLEKPIIRDVNVIHVHTQNSLFCFKIAQYLKKKLNKPVIYQFLAVNYLKNHPRFIVRLFGSLYQQWIQEKAIRLADEVITLNSRDHQLIKEKYGIEPIIIPHGIDEKYLTRPKNASLFKKKYKIHSKYIITYVGRIHPSKGVDILIKAAPFIDSEIGDFIIVIAGKGPKKYERKLVNLIKKLKIEHRVKLLGYLNEDDKISLFDASSVFAFPTRHHGEAHPLVIDEAYAREVPVVATKVGILPYKIRHKKTGMLVPPDTPRLLARAIISLLIDNKLYVTIKKGLLNVKKSLLTWNQVCEKLCEIYEMAQS